MKPFPFRIFLAAVLTAVPAAVQSQQAMPENRVSAYGSGEIRVVPDMAVLTVEAAYTRPSVREAVNETRKAMEAILAAARRAVPDTSLRTTRISVDRQYDWSGGTQRFRGYSASQSLEITVRDLSRLETLLEDLFRAPLTGMGGLDFRHSRADSLRRDAQAMAMRDARDNARRMCAAVGRSCEELVAARLLSAPSAVPVFADARRREMIQSAEAANTMPVQPGMLTFAAAVEADFRLR